MRSRFLIWLMTVAPGLLAPAAEKPNIVLVVVDDLGYAELGCQANDDISTPHIDSLAANGVRCTSGYVSAPVCCPSRAGFITGRYQNRFGHEHNLIGAQNFAAGAGLPVSELTLAAALKQQGYATGLIGKWHLGASAAFHPRRRGFDEFYGFLHEGHFYVPPPYANVTSFLRVRSLPAGAGERLVKDDLILSSHMGYDEPPYDDHNPVLRDFEPVVEREYLTDAWAREAVSFIERHKSEPFFLYLAFNAPHSPLQAASAYMNKFQHIDDIHRRVFAAMVANLDDSIGRVIDKLHQVGVEEDTLVVFFSDNGGPTKELTSSNRPLRGGKGELYEGGIRIPFILSWKGRIPSGQIYREPVISLDVMPTALAACGATSDVAVQLDGVDLIPFIRQDAAEAPHRALYWRYGSQIAVRSGKWKLIRPRGSRRQGAAPWELYDLENDISESKNLAEQRADIVARLSDLIERWNAQMVAPLWGGR